MGKRANQSMHKTIKTKGSNNSLKAFLSLLILAALRLIFTRVKTNSGQVITFGEIGRYGRLGNQLFQVASIIGISRSKKLRYAFPKRIEQSVVGPMFNIQGTIPDEELASVHVMQEEKEGYYDVQIPPGSPLVSLHGYFQSHLYFFEHNNELKKLFKFLPSIVKYVQSRCPQVNLPSTLGIHLRTTDYLNYPSLYRVLSQQYYKQALVMLHNSTIPLNAIIIAADDKVAAVKLLHFIQKLGLYDVPIVISPFDDPAHDLALLSMCRHLVIANSSFSWWGAYLNMLQYHNGTVIAPSPWYKPDGGLSHLNRPDFYLPHWQVLHE